MLSRTQTEALWDQCSAAKDCPASQQLCALPGTEVRDVARDLRVHQPCCVRCINGNVDKHCPSHHIISSIAEKNQKPTKISQEAISNTIQLCSFWLSAVTGSFLSFLFFSSFKIMCSCFKHSDDAKQIFEATFFFTAKKSSREALHPLPGWCLFQTLCVTGVNLFHFKIKKKKTYFELFLGQLIGPKILNNGKWRLLNNCFKWIRINECYRFSAWLWMKLTSNRDLVTFPTK